jgi:streptogramin lyase
MAVGTRGVYALDFWHDRVRLLDGRTLHVVRSLKLKLPFRFSARDNAFRPIAVAVGPDSVWVATARGALAHVDQELRRVVATVWLPFDAFGGMAAGPHAVWVAESLAGVYRIDPGSNHVAARIRMEGFDAQQVVVCDGTVLVLGAAAGGGILSNRQYLVRIRGTRATRVGRLPDGPLAHACGDGSLWLGRQGGSTLERIDPADGRVIAQRHAKIGTALAYADGKLWTPRRDGTVRQLGK